MGDGIKLLQEALAHGAKLQTVILSEGLQCPNLPEGCDLIWVPEDLMAYLSPMQTPQGALFVCESMVMPLPDKLALGNYLILDGLQDPGNVGTIWRSADALGGAGLILTGQCADPLNHKTIRATMGACFRLPVYECGYDRLAEVLRRSNIPLFGTALRSDTADLGRLPLKHTAVAIGSEGRGLSQQLLDLSAATIKIPMREHCESLNAAAAAAIVLWEMGRK